jgi:hypothetical protein
MDKISEINVIGIKEMMDTFNKLYGSFGKHKDTQNFLDLAKSAITLVQGLILRAETSVEEQSKKSYAALANHLINGVSEDLSLFKLFEQSVSDERWKSATNMVLECSNFMGVVPIPAVVLSSSGYFSSQGPRDITTDKEKTTPKYNIVSVEQLHSTILWPNVIHELCHFLILKSGAPDKIYSSIGDYQLDVESTQNKIEEAICDCVSTLIMGPSYPFSYLAQYFQILSNTSHERHPSDSLRLKLMSEILFKSNMPQESNDIEEILINKLGKVWQQDELFPAFDRIINESTGLIKIPECRNFQRGLTLNDFKEDTPSDVYSLFNEGWNIIRSSPQPSKRTYREVSDLILKRLKRGSFSMYSSS